ncbi:MAG: hypothetical protein EYC68_09880 [Chloroflexota bacterium]|nr:MAG: hypothetical protein EYC68_09880 [Chloroflexota bacterium]
MYYWIIYLHIIAAFTFFIAHGVSAFVGLRLRNETNIESIKTLLNLSQSTLGLMYPALLVILLTGIGGGVVGSWWSRGWFWASLGLLALVIVLMYIRGSPYYAQVREAVGASVYGKSPTPAPKSATEIAALLKSSRPIELAVIGGIGLLLLLYLMVFKPF